MRAGFRPMAALVALMWGSGHFLLGAPVDFDGVVLGILLMFMAAGCV